MAVTNSPPLRWRWACPRTAELDAFAADLEAGRIPPGAQVLKHADRRTVWALPEAAGGILLKRFAPQRGRSVWARLRHSQARHEFDMMCRFEELGLPVVQAVACAERWQRGRLLEAFFLGRFVANARTAGLAQRAAEGGGNHEQALQIAREALHLVALLQRQRFLHRDLHADNVLQTPPGQLLLMDLHSVHRLPWVSRRAWRAMIGRLLFSMREVLDLDREAPRLLREHAVSCGQDPDATVLSGLEALAAFERDHVRGRTARCLTRATLFSREALPEGRLFRRRSYATESLAPDLDEHARHLASDSDSVLGRAPRALVTRVGPPDHGRVLKRYTATGWLGVVRYWTHSGRARRAWVGARRFEVLELPTPPAFALLERRDGSAVLVTEDLGRVPSLLDLAASLDSTPHDRRRATVAQAAGHMLGRLARAGLLHADLSAKNLLVTNRPAPQARDRRVRVPPDFPDIQIIDLDGLRRMPPFDAAGLERMLEQLADVPITLTRSEGRRFELGFAQSAGRELPQEVLRRGLARAAARAKRRADRASTSRPAAR